MTWSKALTKTQPHLTESLSYFVDCDEFFRRLLLPFSLCFVVHCVVHLRLVLFMSNKTKTGDASQCVNVDCWIKIIMCNETSQNRWRDHLVEYRNNLKKLFHEAKIQSNWGVIVQLQLTFHCLKPFPVVLNWWAFYDKLVMVEKGLCVQNTPYSTRPSGRIIMGDVTVWLMVAELLSHC